MRLVPQSVVDSALVRMQRPLRTRITLSVAREIAQRQSIQFVVDGSITPLAAGSVLTIRLIAGASGDELASYRHSLGRDPRSFLAALDTLARMVRRKIGESAGTVNTSAPLEEVTTTSLRALQIYNEGAIAQDRDQDWTKAARLMREAI